MRVAIDTSFTARGRSGTAVYLEQLVRALRQRGEVEVVELRQPLRMRRGGRNPARSAVNAALDALWTRVLLPRRARAAGADVVHHPLPAHGGSLPQVITVHDVAFLSHPEWFDPKWRAVAARRHRRAVGRAAVTICVSEAVARQVEGAKELVVAPHGPGQAIDPGERTRPEHFIYVGDDEPRKHVADLVGAWHAYGGDLGLVLAGASARRAGGEIRGEPEPDLAHLFASAAALVHPSRDEGFGLTLLEAMAAGVPVIAVRTAAAEEVCGDAALLVDPGGLAEAMRRVEDDGELRDRLTDAGRARAARFSWARSAELHEQAYRLAAG